MTCLQTNDVAYWSMYCKLSPICLYNTSIVIVSAWNKKESPEVFDTEDLKSDVEGIFQFFTFGVKVRCTLSANSIVTSIDERSSCTIFYLESAISKGKPRGCKVVETW